MMKRLFTACAVGAAASTVAMRAVSCESELQKMSKKPFHVTFIQTGGTIDKDYPRHIKASPLTQADFGPKHSVM